MESGNLSNKDVFSILKEACKDDLKTLAEMIITEKSNELGDDVFNKRYAKALANWIIGPMFSYLDEHKIEITELPISQKYLHILAGYVEFTDFISFDNAKKVLLEMIANPGEHPMDIIIRMGLIQTNDEDAINKIIDEVISEFPDKVKEYKSGKTGVINMLIGQVMKKNKTKINPKLTNELLTKKLCL